MGFYNRLDVEIEEQDVLPPKNAVTERQRAGAKSQQKIVVFVQQARLYDPHPAVPCQTVTFYDTCSTLVRSLVSRYEAKQRHTRKKSYLAQIFTVCDFMIGARQCFSNAILFFSPPQSHLWPSTLIRL